MQKPSRRRISAFSQSPLATDFHAADLTIGYSRHWAVILRRRQLTLGSCIIAPMVAVQNISELPRATARDLPAVVGAFEKALNATLSPSRFNYVISGQSTAVAGAPSRGLHIHAFPRYDMPRHLASREWHDRWWPYFLTFPEIEDEPDEQLRHIRDKLRATAIRRRFLYGKFTK